MSGQGKLPPQGPLAQGADRFAQIVRSVKESQVAKTGAPRLAPSPDSYALSPEEAWARKYTTHCIGPVCYPPLPEAPFARPQLAEAPRIQAFAGQTEPATKDGTSIGQAIGKRQRRGIWRRLFRRH